MATDVDSGRNSLIILLFCKETNTADEHRREDLPTILHIQSINDCKVEEEDLKVKLLNLKNMTNSLLHILAFIKKKHKKKLQSQLDMLQIPNNTAF